MIPLLISREAAVLNLGWQSYAAPSVDRGIAMSTVGSMRPLRIRMRWIPLLLLRAVRYHIRNFYYSLKDGNKEALAWPNRVIHLNTQDRSL